MSVLLAELSLTQARSAAAKKVADSLSELETYIRNNREFIANFGERRRQGETISTAFVESTINQVMSRRFVKKQQMQWTLRGAHLLLQTRTKVLNNELTKCSAGGIRNSGCSHKCRNQSGRRLDPRPSDALPDEAQQRNTGRPRYEPTISLNRNAIRLLPEDNRGSLS